MWPLAIYGDWVEATVFTKAGNEKTRWLVRRDQLVCDRMPDLPGRFFWSLQFSAKRCAAVASYFNSAGEQRLGIGTTSLSTERGGPATGLKWHLLPLNGAIDEANRWNPEQRFVLRGTVAWVWFRSEQAERLDWFTWRHQSNTAEAPSHRGGQDFNLSAWPDSEKDPHPRRGPDVIRAFDFDRWAWSDVELVLADSAEPRIDGVSGKDQRKCYGVTKPYFIIDGERPPSGLMIDHEGKHIVVLSCDITKNTVTLLHFDLTEINLFPAASPATQPASAPAARP